MEQCTVEGCEKPRQRGQRLYCAMHLARLRRHGSVDKVVKPRWRDPKDIWDFVQVGQPTECWLWTGYVQKTGYAQYAAEPAHRVAWEVCNGPIPPGMTIDHLCFVPLCMNPSHMEVVTLAENVRRMNMLYRGRCRKGHIIDGLEDVYVRPDNHRSQCRQCMRERAHKKESVPSPA